MINKNKILWLGGQPNHYKMKILNYINDNSKYKITYFGGIGRNNYGDLDASYDLNLQIIKLNVSKLYFGFSPITFWNFYKLFSDYEWIMIPREKKNTFLLFFAFLLVKVKNIISKNKIKIFTVTHKYFGYRDFRQVTLLEKIVMKFYHFFFDKVIFYTEESMKDAINQKIVNESKARFLNNTIFTLDIDKEYVFSYPNFNKYIILFIGRLVKNKKIDTLIEYFQLINQKLLMGKSVPFELRVIGDGPEKYKFEKLSERHSNVKLIPGTVDEKIISKHMKDSCLVFIPGHSGLSINHAFKYGRPYATLNGSSHGPEIDYIKKDYNGFILESSIEQNVRKIISFLESKNKIIYDNAYKTGVYLSVENYCNQFISALSTDY